MKTNVQTFSNTEFGEKLHASKLEFFSLPQGTPPFQFLKAIGKKFGPAFHKPASFNYLHGSVPFEEKYEAAEQKVRKSRKSGVNEEGTATQAIQNMENIPDTGASKTEILVKSIYKQLKDAYEDYDRYVVLSEIKGFFLKKKINQTVICFSDNLFPILNSFWILLVFLIPLRICSILVSLSRKKEPKL